VTLTIDDDVMQATRLSPEELRVELAVALFQRERLTLAQAAQLAETDRLTFQHILAARRIPLHYTGEDWEQDLRVIQSIPLP
jgi:predicted HTH domain antitoxin